MDSRISKLASMIVNYSLKITKDETVLITYQSNEAIDLVKALIEELYQVGAVVFVNSVDPVITNMLKEKTTSNRIELIRKYQKFEVDNFSSFIHITYNLNDYEGKNVSNRIMKEIGERTYDLHNKRVNERKWVLLNYPSYVDSFKAKMTTNEFYDYVMDVMTLDYSKMGSDIKPLEDLMKKTNKVRITGPGTDITFSIKKMPIIPCVGSANIPDGEIYTAPIKNSVNGVITYNTESTYHGDVYKNIKLEFEKGKIINATCDDKDKNEKLNEIFDIDEGARYIGEFSLGLNPKILNPMGDILFDEKIIGSIHFTPGAAYKDSYNGNDSSVHWDLVLIQRKEYGGGSLYFDDVLVRQDGMFVLEELKHLNYGLDEKK